MIPPNSNPQLPAGAITIICVQFITSVAIMIAAGTYLAGGTVPAQGIEPWMAQLMAAVAAGLLVLGAKFKGIVEAASLKKSQSLGPHSQAGPNTADQNPLPGIVPTAAGKQIRAADAITVASFAIREGAAIIGLVISFLSGNPIWVQSIGAITIVTMALALKK